MTAAFRDGFNLGLIAIAARIMWVEIRKLRRKARQR